MPKYLIILLLVFILKALGVELDDMEIRASICEGYVLH